jgi:hypothetical protein
MAGSLWQKTRAKTPPSAMILNVLTIFNKSACEIRRKEPIWQANESGIGKTIERPCRANTVSAIDGA